MSYTNISFKSVGELVDYVLAGGVLYTREEKNKVELTGIRITWDNGIDLNISKVLDLDWLVKQEWYENIPKGGRLCWLWDGDSTDRSISAVVSKNTMSFITSYGASWRNAEPLTNEEIKAFLVE